jgi:hypothetical protein
MFMKKPGVKPNKIKYGHIGIQNLLYSTVHISVLRIIVNSTLLLHSYCSNIGHSIPRVAILAFMKYEQVPKENRNGQRRNFRRDHEH